MGESLPYLASLLSLSLPEGYEAPQQSPALKRQHTLEALGSWLVSIAEAQPLVLLVEDLHWCDASTLDFLAHLQDEIPTVPMLRGPR